MKNIIKTENGYMLVEIIVASAIALVMAYFLIDITIKLVDKNNDYYIDSVLLTDKNIITKEIMDDINSKKLISVVVNEEHTQATLTYDDGITKEIIIDKENKIIKYGNYTKKLSDEINIEEITLESDNNILVINLPIYTNYSKEDYGIKLTLPYTKDIKIVYPKQPTPAEVTLKKLNLKPECKFTGNFANAATTDEGICSAEDDLGTSYYFRGASTKNYVKFGKYKEDIYILENKRYYQPSDEEFIIKNYIMYNSYQECIENGENFLVESDWKNEYTNKKEYTCYSQAKKGDDMYWRIVRINGDGTIRMIYDGTSAYDNGTDLGYFNRVIGWKTAEYSNWEITNWGVSYWFFHNISSPGIPTSSIIKTLNDSWYSKNFIGTNYELYVADAIYCNDRSLSTENPYIDPNDDGVIDLYLPQFAPGGRLAAESPNLKCYEINDRFSVNSKISNVDVNGELSYPVGMLTLDEAIFAGASIGGEKNNTKYYLYTGSSYWTLSPSYGYINTNSYSSDITNYMYIISNKGGINTDVINQGMQFKPVISLKKDVGLKGSGTMADPFVPIDFD